MSKELEVKQDSTLRGFEPSDLPMSPVAAKEMMEQYQQLMAAILVPWDQRVFKDGKLVKDSDYQRFSTQVVNEKGQKVSVLIDRVKKSGARKLAMATKISVNIVSHTREDRPDGSFVYRYEVKATTLTGRSMPGVGKADSRAMHTAGREEHDTEATAQTRATNRAILDLIGFGQVSAEEMESEPLEPKKVEANAVIKSVNPSVAVHDAHDENAAISLKSDIIDALIAAKLDPNGVEITRGREWNSFILKPIWPTPAPGEQSPWRKYADALKPFGVKYWGKDDPAATDETRYNWTIGV